MRTLTLTYHHGVTLGIKLNALDLDLLRVVATVVCLVFSGMQAAAAQERDVLRLLLTGEP